MEQSVIYQQSGSVATITLNRPKKLNAFNEEMIEQLTDAVDRSKSNEVRCVVITGAGKAFSSGADINDMKQAIESGTKIKASVVLKERYHPLLLGIRSLEKPVVASVNGAAAGIGFSLALACDLIVAARSSIFLLPFVNIGLIPDGGSTELLPAAIGRTRAMGMAMLSEPLTAEHALEIGMINKVFDDDQLSDEVEALSQKLATGATFAYANLKRAINQACSAKLEQQLELEAELQDQCAESYDLAEGVSAFLEKRQPSFKGE